MYPDYKKVVFPYKNKDGSINWVVEFPDLPGCSAVGNTESEALQESKTASELWLDDYFEDHNSYPVPKEVSSSYSGRILLRLPKTLHKELSVEAEEDGVSLNSLIVTLLAQNYGKCVTQSTFNITVNQSIPVVNRGQHAIDYEKKGRILEFPVAI